ncbi:MAG: DNA repair protein RecN [Pseudomonadota bacterium]
MLHSLSIRDFVIVDRLDLEFGSGFTVLTGETGAGKSILIDALALVLGERGDAGVVRAGCERAEIAAEFDLGDAAPLRAWLAANELAEDDACLMRRVIDAGGRSRGFINGRPATLQQLREAGEFLIDIHGQHAHQSLLRAPVQRALLDAHAGLREVAAATADAYRHWQELRRERLACETNAAAFAAEREQLQWQEQELAALNFSLAEWREINAEHTRLAHAVSLLEGAQFGMDALSEADTACLPQLNAVEARLRELLEYDPALQEVLALLDAAQAELQEAVYALRHYQQKLELDPQRLQEAERRIADIHHAARKYRVSPEQLPEMLQQAQARLAHLGEHFDAEHLKRLEAVAQEEYLALAKKLSNGRAKAAKALGKQVSDAMQQLAMAGGRFEIVLLPLEEGNSHGLEQIEFRVAAHAGVEPRALAKVASGGELSRVSLAIQAVTSRVAQVPTLIFDEVDAGIGGRVAEIVGAMLKDLGGRHQVMCVTHLPQVAAAGDRQWQVAKVAKDGSVMSRITALDAPARVEEIARMLGGVKITETTRKHAAEMLGLE